MPSPFSDLLEHLVPVRDQLILAGGFAVNHHGYTRNTLDLDLVCAQNTVHEIKRQLIEAGYSAIETGPVALHSQHPETRFRVDLLPVADETFQILRQEAGECGMDTRHTLPVLSLRHLLAMKIHALACQPAVRRDKDLADIAWLSVLNDLDPETDLHPLCQTCGTPELHHEISNAIRSLRA